MTVGTISAFGVARLKRLATRVAWTLACVLVLVSTARTSLAERVTVPARAVSNSAAVIDGGPAPQSAMVEITLRLAPTADRVAALDQLLLDQTTAGSANYRRWVTPAEFAARYGATDAQIAALTTWAESQQLTVAAVSPSKLRMTVTGTVAAVEAAFGVPLHQYTVAGASYVANAKPPMLPDTIAAMVAGVDGLDAVPVSGATISVAPAAAGSSKAAGADPLAALASAADANSVATVRITSSACSSDFAQTDYDAYRAVLRQAVAEGITVLATDGCGGRGMGSFPASLAEVTAVVTGGGPASSAASGAGAVSSASAAGQAFAGIVSRPAWQAAPGLPADGERDAPDVTVSSMDALVAALASIQQSAGGRVGNINPVLYALGPTPKLYTQPDGATPGTWEAATGLGLVNLDVLKKVFPDGTIGTSSNFQPSTFGVTHGANITYKTIVTSTGGSGIPTGTVTFNAVIKGTTTPVTVIGTATLDATGTATLVNNQLAGGEYSVTSVYSGDSTYLGSTSGVATITVSPESPVITPTVAAGAVVGGNITVNVSVVSASGVGTPSGTVIAAPQGTINTATAQATLSGSNGTATGTILLPIAQAGNFTLLISCTTTDPSFACNQPVSVQAPVGKGNTKTVLTMSPTTPVTGGTITLTATVTGVGNGPTPKGNIEFLDGTTGLQSVALVNGVATYTGTVSSGIHAYNASYGGDANYNVSASTTTSTATGTTPTTTTLTANNNYAVAVGQAITLYSSVFPVTIGATTPTPTGTVVITAASQGTIGTATLIGGLGTLTVTLPAGTYNLTSTYSGDSIYAGSASTSSVIVTVGTPTATLTAALTPTTPVPYGTTASLTATASVPNSTVAPTGSVIASIVGVTGATFTAPLVAAVAGGTSSATITFPAPAPGTYSIQVSCPATGTLKCGDPITVPLITVKGTTTTTLTLNPTAPSAGVKTTLTATIANGGTGTGPYLFTGTVAFFANTQQLATAVVSGTTASASVILPAGSAQTITAVYSGDTNWATSTSVGQPISLTQLASATVVSSNVSSALAGVRVILTAMVGPETATAAIAPTGTVTFYDNYGGALNTLGTAPVVANGTDTSVATLTTSGLAAGTHDIYGIYIGDTVYASSSSSTLPVVFADYTLAFTPTVLTVTQGQTGHAVVNTNLTGSFGGTITLACTPPPNTDLTCSFSPATLTGGGTSTLTVVTVAGSATSSLRGVGSNGLGRRGSHRSPLDWGLPGGSALALALMLRRPKRRRLAPLVVVLLAVALSGMIGCGVGTSNLGNTSSTGGTTTASGSPLGTQIFSIVTAGTDGINTVRHDFTYQVVIQ